MEHRFATTRYPGYLWCTETFRLYSYKSGILKPLKLQKPSKFNFYKKGYRVSHFGRRCFIHLDSLMRLKAGPIWIPIEQ